MKDSIVQQLLALNQAFYRQFAASFAETRRQPQPGFHRLLRRLPDTPFHLLDVGCGDGRLARFLSTESAIAAYSGVDFSADLLLLAEQGQSIPTTFYQRDLSQKACLDGLPRYDVIACLSTFQHIPGRDNRLRLLREMGRHLAPTGIIVMANWQFLSSPRQRRKLVEWTEIGLSPADLEERDYLLSWQRDGFGLRYVCLIDEQETHALASVAGLEPFDQFRSDGREGDLNLYTFLRLANG